KLGGRGDLDPARVRFYLALFRLVLLRSSRRLLQGVLRTSRVLSRPRLLFARSGNSVSHLLLHLGRG
ncbi:hypothetical protein PFISCL1PPCAC_23484, partial [Pristionchus fissidentatus]